MSIKAFARETINHEQLVAHDHSQKSVRKCAVIDLEQGRRRRWERIVGRRIEELMFLGGYDLFTACRKATSEYVGGRNMAPPQATGTTNNPLRKEDKAIVFFMPGQGKPGS